MPTRSWSDVSRAYRYGFNGKEKDFETANDNYDFGARIYDGRLGRWLSLDPLHKVNVDLNPYNAFGNNPILIIDINGEILAIDCGTDVKTYKDGKLFNSDGTEYAGGNEFADQVFNNIKLLTNTETGLDIVNNISNNAEQTVTIKLGTDNKYDKNSNTLYTTNEPIKLPVADSENTPTMQSTESFIVLGHELAHAESDLNGTYDDNTWVWTTSGIRIIKDEIYACHIENKIRAENGFPLRTDYTLEPTRDSPGDKIPITGRNTNTTATKLIDIDGNSIYYKMKVYNRFETELKPSEFIFGGVELPNYRVEYIETEAPYNYKQRNGKADQ